MSPAVLQWIIFGVIIAVMLVLDLGVFHRKAHTVKTREALLWSAVWIGLALLFNLGIYLRYGSEKALEFLTGYLIEKSLSVDNIFVFLLVFSFFRVPSRHQHKVLFWGIVGALVMRAVFIAAGIALITKFEWIVYLFGALLVVSGTRMAIKKDEEIHPEKNPVFRLLRRFIPMTEDYEEARFFTHRNGRHAATPLFVVLVFIETTDVIFAVDSIPAILAITRDPFIVYTSNVFAILGLRALYFALAGVMGKFEHLHYGLAAVLVFVGIKMLLEHFYHIPVVVSLGVISVILLISVTSSLIGRRKAS